MPRKLREFGGKVCRPRGLTLRCCAGRLTMIGRSPKTCDGRPRTSYRGAQLMSPTCVGHPHLSIQLHLVCAHEIARVGIDPSELRGAENKKSDGTATFFLVAEACRTRASKRAEETLL